MNKKQQILKSFSDMDISKLELLLNDSYTYQDAEKNIFLEKLEELFEEFKSFNDSQLILEEGKCIDNYCENCSCTGYALIGNNSMNHSDFIFKETKDDFIEIFYCDGFEIDNNDIELNDSIVIKLNTTRAYIEDEKKENDRILKEQWDMIIPFEKYYQDGTLYKKGYYKNQKLQNSYEEYHENGKLKISANYDNGMVEGVYKSFDRLGVEKTNYSCKDGSYEGAFVLFNKFAQLLLKCNFDNNKLNGSFERYCVSSEEVSDATSCFPLIRNKKSPYKLLHNLNFKNDKLHGLCQLFDTDHDLFGEGVFEDGVPIGTHNFYHYKDQLYCSITFDDGICKNDITFFDIKGEMMEALTPRENNIIKLVNNKEYLILYTQIKSSEIPLMLNRFASWYEYNNDNELKNFKGAMIFENLTFSDFF